MFYANSVAAALLEADPDKINLDDYVDALVAQRESGEINASTARDASRFYHRHLTYKNRKEPLEARRNGATKYWKREPGKFRIPVKYGMYDYFYIDNKNAHKWSTKPLPPKI